MCSTDKKKKRKSLVGVVKLGVGVFISADHEKLRIDTFTCLKGFK